MDPTYGDHPRGHVYWPGGNPPKPKLFVTPPDDGAVAIPAVDPFFEGPLTKLKLHRPDPIQDRKIILALIDPRILTGDLDEVSILNELHSMGLLYSPARPFEPGDCIRAALTTKARAFNTFIFNVRDRGDDATAIAAVTFLSDTRNWGDYEFGDRDSLENGVREHGADFLRALNEFQHSDPTAVRIDFDQVCHDVSKGLRRFKRGPDTRYQASLASLDPDFRNPRGGFTDGIKAVAATAAVVFGAPFLAEFIPRSDWNKVLLCLALVASYIVARRWSRGTVSTIAGKNPDAQVTLGPVPPKPVSSGTDEPPRPA